MNEPSEELRERQAGDYTPPILTEPTGGPVPPWKPGPATEPN